MNVKNVNIPNEYNRRTAYSLKETNQESSAYKALAYYNWFYVKIWLKKRQRMRKGKSKEKSKKVTMRTSENRGHRRFAKLVE